VEVGERAADFVLPDQTGREWGLRAALAQGPVLLVFYRGDW
jgi:peroxiredoxin